MFWATVAGLAIVVVLGVVLVPLGVVTKGRQRPSRGIGANQEVGMIEIGKLITMRVE
jgi:hypothetical protein